MEKLKPRDIDILTSFLTFPFLTAEQVCRLHYANTSLTYVRERLNYLEQKRYLNKKKYEKTLYPFFYSLALRGTRLLEHTPPFYPVKLPFLPQADHLLMTNEVLISSLKITSFLPHLIINECLHDFSLKTILKVAMPDAYVVVRTENERIPICFEIHLHTGEANFKKKIGKIIESVRGEYREVFKTTAVTWAFVTTNELELERIIVWTQDELTKIGEIREADIFRFAYIPAKNIDPVNLFYNPIFRRTYTDFTTSLI